MIARIWHGRTRAEHADEYADYIRRTGVEGQRGVAGNRASMVLRRVEDGEAHFYVISLWESLDAIKRFAGADAEVAVYYPEDDKYLLELESHVQHYDMPAFEIA